uniref:Uncharacterized protein n=1 Tax=Trypanosoma vivax (strain Y486) TaxID=1055687 RepID=G0UC08_TRYVY|nr:hypothetical protein TVY486_1108400 [Trypanosoma vivax Y486]
MASFSLLTYFHFMQHYKRFAVVSMRLPASGLTLFPFLRVLSLLLLLLSQLRDVDGQQRHVSGGIFIFRLQHRRHWCVWQQAVLQFVQPSTLFVAIQPNVCTRTRATDVT